MLLEFFQTAKTALQLRWDGKVCVRSRIFLKLHFVSG